VREFLGSLRYKPLLDEADVRLALADLHRAGGGRRRVPVRHLAEEEI
jgi:hypothetical protein